MPMYEYSCAACGHSDTLLEKVGSPASKKCPSCGKPRAFKKQLSAPSFHLKGTGWYATDFRDNGKPRDKERKAKGDANTSSTGKKAEESGRNDAKTSKAKAKETADA